LISSAQFYLTIGVIPIVWLLVAVGLPSRLPWSLAGWVRRTGGWAGSARRRRRGDWLIERFDVLDSPGDGFCRLDGFLDSGDDRRPRDRSIGNKDRLYVDDLYNNTPTQQFLAPNVTTTAFVSSYYRFRRRRTSRYFSAPQSNLDRVPQADYPQITSTPFHLPDGSPTILFEVSIPKQ